MKTILKISVVATALSLLLIADVDFLMMQLVPDADAVYGTRRRTRRRTAVVVSAASKESAESTSQQSTAPQQPAEAQPQPAAATPAPAPPPAGTGKALPMGTVVTSLPGGCTAKEVGGTEYYACGANYYRAAFQGDKLVYVTTKP